MDSTKELIKELWSTWEALAECGEISIGPNFSKQYDSLKARVEQKLNIHSVSGGLPDCQTLIDFLESTKLKHHISDDCWYSCPMSDEGCCNHEEKGCNCGAEAHNKKIDDFIKQHLGKPKQLQREGRVTE